MPSTQTCRTLKDDGGGYQFAEVSKVAEAFGFEFPSFNNKEILAAHTIAVRRPKKKHHTLQGDRV